jgi:hypothetical protein
MTDLESRVTAIGELLTDSSSSTPAPEVVEAAVACCRDLVDAGEPKVALDLLAHLIHSEGLAPSALLSLVLIQVKALRIAGEHRSAYETARARMEEFPDWFESSSAEATLLRIHTAGCLWQLNRVEDAVESLGSLRHDLAGRADSQALAQCMHELSSAEILEGV